MTNEELQHELYGIATIDPSSALPRWEKLIESYPPEDYGFRVVRLLPAVWKNLKVLKTPFAASEILESKYNSTEVANRQIEVDCREVIEFFENHGVETLILKGLVWTRMAHKDLGVRPTCDFDILIKTEQAELAQDLLRSDGWEFIGEEWCPHERLSNASTYHKDGRKLDLHWSLLWESRRPESNECFWQEKQPIDLGGYPAWTLSFRHHLFHLAASANREFFHQARYLYDLGAFLNSCPEQVVEHIPHVHQMLRERRLLYRLESLPLVELGWSHLLPAQRASLLDRLWSMASGHPHGPHAELLSGLFPFLDYWQNYRGQNVPGWSLPTYLKRRLEIEDPKEVAKKAFLKIFRLIGLAAPAE